MNFIAFFDKFGAFYKPKIKLQKKNYKSVFGGVISLVIYLASFMYLVYKIHQFGSNSMNPIQSIAYEFQETLSMQDNGELINIQIQNTKISPFNKTNQILIPFAMIIGANEGTIITNGEQIYENNEIDFTTQTYTPKNLALSIGNSESPTKIMVGFTICIQEINGNCADSSTIDSFFLQSGLLVRTSIITKQYNSFTKQINAMSRYVDFALDNTMLFYQRVIMEAQLLDIDDGILFPSSTQNWLYNDFSIQTQSIRQSFAGNFNSLFMTELSISQVTQRKSVQFIKISAVLADVGSIFSSFMMISVIVSLLNEFLMEREIIDEIIGIYYPQFKQLSIEKTFYIGPIRQVKLNDKIINLESFVKFYNKACKIAQRKLTVYSSAYQISRLQFALQNILSREEVNKMHQQGISLNLLYDSSQTPRENQVYGESQPIKYEELQSSSHYSLKDEDFSLLDQNNESSFELHHQNQTPDNIQQDRKSLTGEQNLAQVQV